MLRNFEIYFLKDRLKNKVYVMEEIIKSPLIVYDGFCGMCHGFVGFVIKNDPNNSFYFTPRDSEVGLALRKKYDLENVESILFFNGEEVFIYSDASLKILQYLKKPYRYFSNLIIFPRFFRDIFYDLIAKIRYYVAGRKSTCLMAPKGLEDKFI